MDKGTRACVAYVAGRLVSGVETGSIYDHSESKHVSISGEVYSKRIAVYDYGRNCHFSGNPPNLFDYGTSSHLTLNVEGARFDGYDFHGKSHFSGSVSGGNVDVYDFAESRHFSYSIASGRRPVEPL